jgi:uncharacterized damage-inducible protein DinB
MRSISRVGTLVALALTLAWPASAQAPEGLMSDLLKDLDQVEKKILGLAEAMPASAFEWRPGEGVRSTSETFMHIAADNYFMPAVMGTAAPAETGVNKEYKSAQAFEQRKMARDQVLAEVRKSFAFLRQSMTGFPAAKMDAPLEVFGQKMTNRSMWIATMTHLHEHLGQLIAYARTNKVTPPWSS